MNLQSKFGYCITTQTLNIALCKRDGITDRQTDDQKTKMTPGHLSGRGHKNSEDMFVHYIENSYILGEMPEQVALLLSSLYGKGVDLS